MSIGVLGPSGTAGRRVVAHLERCDEEVVPISRSAGVDLVSGAGLPEALSSVRAVIDVSNPFPTTADADLVDTFAAAARSVVDTCAAAGVEHLVLLSIVGTEDPAVDDFAYFRAKRAQERVVDDAPVRTTIVKSTQWYEYATNPASVRFDDQGVEVEDWFIQPVAVDAVAEALAQTVRSPEPPSVLTVAGPDRIRLPDLTAQLLARRGDDRAVRATPPPIPAMGDGTLLAPADARIIGPDLDTWLRATS